MGKKGKWFGMVKKVFSPEPKEKKANEQKAEKLKSVKRYPASTSETGNGPSEAPLPIPIVDVLEETMEQQESEVISPVATANAGATATKVTVEVVRPTQKVSKFHGKPKEDVAAIMIQTAFRGYQARRGLPALKGLVRLKSLVDGDAAKRQVTTTLRCMQTLSRVQSQIQSRRIRLTEEKQALQRLKREQELEALKASMGDEWDDSLQTKEQIDASLMSKHEAAIRRERAMAYAFSHQRKNTLKSGFPLFTDLNNPHWEWSCLERLTTSKPGESATIADKEPSNDQASVKSTIPSVGVEITNAYAKRDTKIDKQSSGTQKSSRQAVRQSSVTPTPKALSMAKNSKTEGQKGGQINSEDDDSRSMLSLQLETNRRHTLPGSTLRDDENLINPSTSPNFMTPTKSARAKSRFHSPSSENIETPDRASNNSTKKRLSLLTVDKHSVSSPARRHSGPPKVSDSSVKVAHSECAPDTAEVV